MDQNKPSSSLQEQVTDAKSELWNLSFRDLFYKYVRFLPLFVLSVAIALLGAFMYLRYTTPIYGVGGSMLIRNDQGTNKNNKFDEIVSSGRNFNLQSEIEILKARPLMERVVDSLDLQISYTAKGKIKSVNIYKGGPFLLQPLVLADSQRSFTMKIKFLNNDEFRVNDDKTVIPFGRRFKNGNGEFILIRNTASIGGKDYSVSWTPTSAAAGAFAGAIQVIPKGTTGILNVSMRTTNSYMGADIINKLMNEYGKYSIEQKNQASDQTLEFIDARLIHYKAKIDSTDALADRKRRENQIIDARAQIDKYMETVSETDKEIIIQREFLNKADYISNYLQDKKYQYNTVVAPSSLGLEDATLNGFVTEYNKAQIERQIRLDANIPVKNPAVTEINDQIEKIRISILESLKNIRSTIGSQISSLQRKTELDQSQLTSLPAKEKEQLDIERQAEAFQSMYKLFLEERERTAISRVATTSNSVIIDRAYPTTVPVKPNKRTIQLLAILLGLALPALFIFASEVLNDKVATRFDIEKITAAPILGEIGHSYSDNVLVVNKTTRSMVAEQFRIIRSNLQYVLHNKEKATILFTSSFSGEGKSYVSTNMGAVLALAGKKTVILEFDIRKPKILSGLGMSKGAGISNFLVGKAKLEDLIKQVPDQENLFVLGCGPIPPNPAELLLDPKVDEMFDWLKNNYDIVIVDTAPVGMVSDAMTLSKFADATLYLVRQGHTFKKQVALIDEFYKENKLPRVSVIINDVKLKPGYGYYGYGRYGYGYGYGYGSYYEEETPPTNFFDRVLGKLDFRRWFKKSRKK